MKEQRTLQERCRIAGEGLAYLLWSNGVPCGKKRRTYHESCL